MSSLCPSLALMVMGTFQQGLFGFVSFWFMQRSPNICIVQTFGERSYLVALALERFLCSV